MTPHLPFYTAGDRHAPRGVPGCPDAKRYFISTIFFVAEKLPALIV